MKKVLYSFITISLMSFVVQAQVVEDPSGPRKPVIDNISAGGTVVGSADVQMAQVSNTTDPDLSNGQSTAGSVSGPDAGESLAINDQVSQNPGTSELVEMELHIYPVPATTTLTLDLGTEAAAKISIANVIGRTVYTELTSTRTLKIDVSSLTSGTYFVTVNVGDQIITRKIQITRS